MRRLRDIDRTIIPLLQWVPGQAPEIEYALVPEGYRGDQEKQVQGAIARFYEVMNRYPDTEELALEVGDITPKKAKDFAFRTRRETGWRPPTEKEKEESRREIGEILVLGARIKADPTKDWVKSSSYRQEEVEEAKHYLETYPELIPAQIRWAVLEWPEEAKRYLGGDYTPIDRQRPIVRSK
jgi:hypothetical protein